MKMTMHINEDVLAAVMKITGVPSKTKAVEVALTEMVRKHRFKELCKKGLGLTPEELRNAWEDPFPGVSSKVAEESPPMAGNVLVDSSFYIHRLRAGMDPFEEFGEHVDTCDFFTCGIVKMEVLRGVKHKNAHRRMIDLMDCMLHVPTPNGVWERAERLAWELDRAGNFMQITDLIIAVCALDADAAVLTLDSDFGNVPGLRTLRMLG